MGIIALQGMEFYAHHGYYTDEITRGNKFVVDLTMEAETAKPGQSDDLEDALNYENIYNMVKAEMEIRSNLLEHAAHRILDKLTEQFKAVQSAELTIAKLNPPLKGIVQQVSVTIKQ